MNAIKKWFLSHSINAHTFNSAWIAADALWYTNKDFKDYVWGVYVALPRPIHGIIAGVAVPVLVYWGVKKRFTNQEKTP